MKDWVDLRGLKLTLAAKHAPGSLCLLAIVCLTSIGITCVQHLFYSHCALKPSSSQLEQQPAITAELMQGRL